MQIESAQRHVPLTLVIPTFNRAELIAETLDSALAQEMPFAEIIVVDDGSTDDTPRLLTSYAGRIRTIRTDNSGVQHARNVGVAASRTSYVTLCDSDDLLQSKFVGTVAAWLATRPDIDIVYSNFSTFDGESIGPDKFSQAPEGWFEGAQEDVDFCWKIPDLYIRTVAYQPLFPTGATFKKQFYEKLDGYDERFNHIGGEDWEFTLRAIEAGNVALCKKTMTRIRKHAANDSGDPVKLFTGEAKILEHALEHHAAAADHVAQIRQSIVQRRLTAFDKAFASGDFFTANDVLTQLQPAPAGVKFAVKRLITALPGGLRTRVWQLTQR